MKLADVLVPKKGRHGMSKPGMEYDFTPSSMKAARAGTNPAPQAGPRMTVGPGRRPIPRSKK